MHLTAAQQIAERRILALPTEADYFARRDQLKALFFATSLSAVQTGELRLLEEACDEIDAAHPRMDNPRGW